MKDAAPGGNLEISVRAGEAGQPAHEGLSEAASLDRLTLSAGIPCIAERHQADEVNRPNWTDHFDSVGAEPRTGSGSVGHERRRLTVNLDPGKRYHCQGAVARRPQAEGAVIVEPQRPQVTLLSKVRRKRLPRCPRGASG